MLRKMILSPDTSSLLRLKTITSCSTSILSKSFSEKATKEVYTPPNAEAFKWRTPSSQRPGEWFTKFKVFAPEKLESASVIKFLQAPFTPKTIKKWYRQKQEQAKVTDQRFIPERNQILGNELAAAHFIVHRGGALKFYDDNKWIKRDEYGDYDLPNTHMSNYVVEAIDLEKMQIYYEGLENLKGLKNVKSISLRGCYSVDDWHIDRISGFFYKTLEVLNIKECEKITSRGLEALGRLEKLQKLYIDQKTNNKSYELALIALEEHNPTLQIIYD